VKIPSLLLVLPALALTSAFAAGQAAGGDASALADSVRQALQNDPRSSAEARQLEQQRLLDLQLAQLVNQRLIEVTGLSGLVVACHDGNVELRGQADTAGARRRATELAFNVVGVSTVANGLRLPGETEPLPEPERLPILAQAPVEPAPRALTEPFGFATRDGLAGRGIRVEVRDGLVGLRGEVNSDQARLYATTAAQSVAGVRAVRSDLVVRRATKDESRRLAVLILKQLEYDPLMQPVAPMLLVTVRDGVVQLDGRVQDASQLDRAQDIAAVQVGVFAVDNRLQIDEELTLQPTRRSPYTAVMMR